MKTLRFGIEIETVGQPREAVARAIHSVVGGNLNGASVRTPDGRVWQVVHDGSLSGFRFAVDSMGQAAWFFSNVQQGTSAALPGILRVIAVM